ncbi:MAG: sulfotransferase [Cyanobacteria bacterium J06649_4]
MRKKVIFIMGTAHCGSTLLTMVLGSHTECLALGEVSNFPEAYRKGKPICAVCQGECSFWNHRFSPAESQLLVDGFSEQRLHKHIPLKLEKKVRGLLKMDQVFNPYSLIASKVDETVLIDSTKTVYWLTKKLAAREFTDHLLEPYLIHLIRDGRAVMGSYSRRKQYQGLSAQDFGEQFGTLWKTRLNNENNFFDRYQGNKRQLRYEEFATQPEKIATDLCDWLGIPFEVDMLNYWKHQHHTISGNGGTRASVKKYQEKNSTEKSSLEQKAYKNAEQNNAPTAAAIAGKHTAPAKDFGIRLNVKWPKTLSSEQLEAFYRTTNNMNKAYEWESADPS